MPIWKSHLSKLKDMEFVFISDYLCLIVCGRFMYFRQRGQLTKKTTFPNPNTFTFKDDNCLEKPIFSQQPP